MICLVYLYKYVKFLHIIHFLTITFCEYFLDIFYVIRYNIFMLKRAKKGEKHNEKQSKVDKFD